MERDDWPSAMMDPAQRARLLDECSLEVVQQDGLLRLYLRHGRQRGMALMTGLVGTAFLAGAVALPDQGFASAVIPYVFGFFGVSLLVLAAYLPFNTLDVRVSRHRLKRVRSWLGFSISSLEIAPDELEELDIDRRGSATHGSRATICYELVGRGRFGRVKLIESVPDRLLVEAIRRQVMLAAGLKLSPGH